MQVLPSTEEQTASSLHSNRKSARRRPQIHVFTGLRALAALWVFFFHRAIDSITNEIDQWHLQWIGMTGQTAVVLFFTLSGFVMVWNYGHCSFKSWTCHWSFWSRRLARILPLYYLSLLVSIYDVSCIWRPDNSCSVADWIDIILMLIPIKSWIFFSIGDIHWNPVLWTVQIEIFFYLVFPLTLRFVRHLLHTTSIHSLTKNLSRKKIIQRLIYIWLVASLISILPLIFRISLSNDVELPFLHLGKRFAYITPYTRFPEFVFGMITGIFFILMTTERHDEEYELCPASLTKLEPDAERRETHLPSHFQRYSNYNYACLLVDIYCLCQIFFFSIIHSPLLSRTKEFTKYDSILMYGPLIASVMCSNLYLYARYTSSLISNLLSTTILISMGDISYAFYCLAEALPKLALLATNIIETSTIMRFWAAIGASAAAHYYIEVIFYNWVNKKSCKCNCS